MSRPHWRDNTTTVLASPLAVTDDKLWVLDPSRLPMSNATEWFYITIINSAENEQETLKVVGDINADGSYTIERASLALAFQIGDRVELRLCSALLEDIWQRSDSGATQAHANGQHLGQLQQSHDGLEQAFHAHDHDDQYAASDHTHPYAEETMAGVVSRASDDMAYAGNDVTHYVTPKQLHQAFSYKAATETSQGTLRVATDAQVQEGVVDDRAVTPAKLRQAIAAHIRDLQQPEVLARESDISESYNAGMWNLTDANFDVELTQTTTITLSAMGMLSANGGGYLGVYLFSPDVVNKTVTVGAGVDAQGTGERNMMTGQLTMQLPAGVYTVGISIYPSYENGTSSPLSGSVPSDWQARRLQVTGQGIQYPS